MLYVIRLSLLNSDLSQEVGSTPAPPPLLAIGVVISSPHGEQMENTSRNTRRQDLVCVGSTDPGYYPLCEGNTDPGYYPLCEGNTDPGYYPLCEGNTDPGYYPLCEGNTDPGYYPLCEGNTDPGYYPLCRAILTRDTTRCRWGQSV